jgi:glucan phosphoethanolaminetransferase (alkaline phosphatase superfamily)
LEYIVYFVSGGIGLLLIVRFFLKLAGAGPSSEVVSTIYNISNYLIAPFEGIFKTTNSQGAETTSVFEPSTVITFIVFWVVSAIIIWVLRVIFRKN